RVEGGASISVPIFNRGGDVRGALSLIAPEIRLRKIDIEQAGQKMIDIASQLEHLYQSAGVVLEYCP
ncbi:MAG: IclR family transcriptional regulator C-terminal domain-containing protein, partial [Anaerolineaceae bacterium]